MNALATALTDFVLKPTVVIVAMLVLQHLLRRSSAATRHASLTLALAGLLALPFLSAGLPAWNLEVLPPAVFEQAAASTLGALEDRPLDGKPMGPVPDGDPAAAAGGIAGGPSAGGATALFGGWLLPVWLAGAAFVLVKVAAGLARMHWIVRRAEAVTDPEALRLLEACRETLGSSARPRLVVSDRVGVPLVWGWRRPALILPRRWATWTAERLRAVMLHELGHLKRSDWPVLLLGRVVASIYWFHPLVWYLERCARRECERACDDLVLASGTKPSDYASHLLSIARGSWDGPREVRAALAVVRRSHLERRLRFILDPVLRRGVPSKTAVALMCGALTIALVPFASVQLAKEARADEPGPDGVRQAGHVHEKGGHGKTAYDEPEGDSEGERLYQRAYELHGESKYDEAIEAFEEALALGYRPETTSYNIACCHALLGDASAAASWMEKARAAGWDRPEAYVEDSDFDPIQSSATFQRAVDEAFEAAGKERLAAQHYPYRDTLDAYRAMKEEGSTGGKLWYEVGSKLLAYRELDMAVDALTEAVEHMGQWNQNAMYNLACAHSLNGSTSQALQWLDRTVEAGFNQHERFLNDSDLDGVRGTSQFEQIVAKSETLSLGRFPRREWERSDYSESRWAPAVASYESYVKSNPASGRGWFNLGWALHFSSRHDEAIEAWDRALALGHRPATTTYNLACANAMLGRTSAAVELLRKAVGYDAIGYEQLAGDEDLKSLHGDAGFQELLSALESEMQEREAEKKEKAKVKQRIQAMVEEPQAGEAVGAR
jgi:beta-lactamase regulating signal transducer with metallopeptidase domain/tetratricopeptide (TPR) repeat protein